MTERYLNGGVVSPDGKMAALVSSEQHQLTLVDLATGAAQRLPEQVSSQMAWSADGRFLIYIDARSTLRYFDRTTERTTALTTELQDAQSMSWRPAH